MFKFIVVSLFFSASLAFSDFPAEEVWRVELDTTATVLGPSWQDDDGNMFFLIGLQNKAVIVINEEIVWESLEFEGLVTAVSRIDFGSGDGFEIIVATAELELAKLHCFTGEELEEQSMFVVYPLQSPGLGEYPICINTIDTFPELLPDSSKTIYLGYFRGKLTPYYNIFFDGLVQAYSLTDSAEVNLYESDVIISSAIEEWINNGRSQLIVGTEFEYISNDYPENVTTYCQIKVLDSDLELINTHLLAEFFFDGEGYYPRFWAKFCDLSMVERDQDEESILITAYSDTSGFQLSGFLNEDLELDDHVSLPYPGGTLNTISHYRYPAEESEDDFIVCFYSLGGVCVVDIDNYRVADCFQYILPAHYGSMFGNYDDDEEIEMAYLTENEFIMYDIGQLATPSPSEPDWIPERYAITSAYPNPFNSSTTIEYVLPKSGSFEITVHDLTGREIERLMNGWNIPGRYSLSWEAFGMQSGTYFISLKANGSRTARMIHLLK